MPYIPIYLQTNLDADPPEYQDNHYEAFAKTNDNMAAFKEALDTTLESMETQFRSFLDEAVEEIQSQSVPYHTHYLTGGIDCGLVSDEETPIPIGTVNLDAVFLDGGTF